MARISGVDLPRDKRIEIGLTYVYGIGRDVYKRQVLIWLVQSSTAKVLFHFRH